MHQINSEKVKQRLSIITTESDHRVWGPQALLIWGESSSLCFLPKKTRAWGSCVWQQKAAYFMPAVLALGTHLEWTDLIKFFTSWTHLRNKLSNASTSSVFYEMHDALVTWKGSGVVETLTPTLNCVLYHDEKHRTNLDRKFYSLSWAVLCSCSWNTA